MKKFLSALVVMVMVGTLAISSFAAYSPAQAYIPTAPAAPTPASPTGDIQNPDDLPDNPFSGLLSDDGQPGLTIVDENGNPAGFVPVTVKTIANLPADDPARALLANVMDDLGNYLPGVDENTIVAYALNFEVPNAGNNSVFADNGGEFHFYLTLSGLANAINPRVWFWNSETGKFDEGKLNLVSGNQYSITTAHVCPMIITVEGYESYYSRFVGKKVVSPDTLEVVSGNSVCSVVSLLGTVGVSKKHN